MSGKAEDKRWRTDRRKAERPEMETRGAGDGNS